VIYAASSSVIGVRFSALAFLLSARRIKTRPQRSGAESPIAPKTLAAA